MFTLSRSVMIARLAINTSSLARSRLCVRLCSSSGGKDSSNSVVTGKNDRPTIIGALKDKEWVDEDFYVVFRFPYVRQFALFTRIKIYQTAITVLGVVPYYLYHSLITGSIHPSTTALVLGIGTFAVAALIGTGEVFRRIVGALYYNPREDLVRISHISFWGYRTDEVWPLEAILPLSETSEHIGKIVWRIHSTDDSQRKLFMCTRYGGVKDLPLFEGSSVWKSIKGASFGFKRSSSAVVPPADQAGPKWPRRRSLLPGARLAGLLKRPEISEADGDHAVENSVEEDGDQKQQTPRFSSRSRAAAKLLEEAAKNVPQCINEEKKS